MDTFKREIFEQLGNLFYALAMEQNASPITSGELKMAVRKDWLGKVSSTGGDGNVPEAAHVIGLAIDTLQADHTPASQAYSAFEKFFRKHEEQFSYALKQQILETARKIMEILPSKGKTNKLYDSLKSTLHRSMEPTENH